MKLTVGTFALSVQGSGLIPSAAKKKNQASKKEEQLLSEGLSA